MFMIPVLVGFYAKFTDCISNQILEHYVFIWLKSRSLSYLNNFRFLI